MRQGQNLKLKILGLLLALGTLPSHADSLSGFSDVGLVYVPARLGLSETLNDNLEAEVDAAIVLRPRLFHLNLPLDVVFGPDLKQDPDSLQPPPFNDKAILRLHRALGRLSKARIPVLGSVIHYPSWLVAPQVQTQLLNLNENLIPCRSTGEGSSGSPYYRFLGRYSNALSALVAQFSEIQSWEPAVETNIGLMPLAASGCESSLVIEDRSGALHFTYSETVGITVDLMYEAHAAIHATNSAALIFMPPPASVYTRDSSAENFGSADLSGASVAAFMTAIYEQITANKREYFDAIAWHPNMDGNGFVTAAEKVHAVIEEEGDGELPIVFSEVSGGISADTLNEVERSAQEHLTWLSYIVLSAPALEPATSDLFCAQTNCLSPAPNGPFKALLLGAKTWTPFYLKDGLYCQFTGTEQLSAAANLEVVDMANSRFVGICQQ